MSPIKRSFPAVMFVFCLVSDISGETINQRQWEIDGDYYWRFTQEVSENHLYGISLFDECYALTLIIQQNEDEEERVYQVGTDPFWNRIVAGRLDYWVEAFGQWGSGPYEFKHPHGIERDLYGVIYVADTGNNRISAYRTDFEDASDPQLTHLWDIADDGSGNIKIPYGVSWDDNGSICYEDDDCLWVANTGNHEIIGYDLDYSGYGGYNNMWPQGVLTMPAFPYDNSGHPSGSFHFPKGVVRGRELWPTNYDNQSTNTDWLYVVDTGNERIVRLRYENTMSPGPTPEYFNEYRSDVHSDFTSATVDAFGDLYITDRFNHRIIKLNDRLQYLVEFGQAGTGQISGLLLSPTFMSTAFKSWYRPVWCPQWISYDTAILGEHWTSGSGGIQYGFGIDVLDLRTYNDYSLMRPACDWTLTSPGVYECRVFRTSDGALLKVFSGEVGNSGKVTVWWDRIDDSGCYHTESENLQFEITPIPFYEGIESGPTRTSPVLASVKTYYNDCGNNVCNQDENLVQGVRGNWGDTPAATYVGDASEIICVFRTTLTTDSGKP